LFFLFLIIFFFFVCGVGCCVVVVGGGCSSSSSSCSVRPFLRADSGVKRSVTKIVQVCGYKYHNSKNSETWTIRRYKKKQSSSVMHLLLSLSFNVTATLAFHHIKLKHFNMANIVDVAFEW
jgi:hypothetical protein